MTTHRPQPGPMYWDYRCLVCSDPVKDHPSIIEMMTRRVKGWLKWQK